jgi:hypothetical protein
MLKAGIIRSSGFADGISILFWETIEATVRIAVSMESCHGRIFWAWSRRDVGVVVVLRWKRRQRNRDGVFVFEPFQSD